jgi:hypothetical protein
MSKLLGIFLCLALGTGVVLSGATTDGQLAAEPGGPKAKDEKGKDKGPKDKGPKDKEKGEKGKHDKKAEAPPHLRHPYETLVEVSLLVPTGEKADKEFGKLFSKAKELYRTALTAETGNDHKASHELAGAANDAAKGLKHTIWAGVAAQKDLPAPPLPEGKEPADAVRELLTRTHDRITKVGDGTTETGKQFLAASRRAYNQARTAYQDKDYRRAGELARAAEAWAHVEEHIAHAGGEPGAGRPRDLLPPPLPPEE